MTCECVGFSCGIPSHWSPGSHRNIEAKCVCDVMTSHLQVHAQCNTKHMGMYCVTLHEYRQSHSFKTHIHKQKTKRNFFLSVLLRQFVCVKEGSQLSRSHSTARFASLILQSLPTEEKNWRPLAAPSRHLDPRRPFFPEGWAAGARSFSSPDPTGPGFFSSPSSLMMRRGSQGFSLEQWEREINGNEQWEKW